MTPVQRINPLLRDIHAPGPLRDMPYWLCWRYETREADKKPLKVPVYASGERRYGQQGSPNDLAKLTTFAVARDAAIRRNMDGVGFAHTEAGGVVTLDFDNCVRDGVVDPQVLELVEGTYAEFSPSGKGVHAIFSASHDVLGNPKSLANATRFGVEAFSSTGFTTFSGWMLEHVDLLGYEDRVAPLPRPVIDFCQTRFGPSSPAKVDPDDFMIGREPRLGLTVERMMELVSSLDPDMGRDDWVRVGMALHHECEGDDTGFSIWDDWSSDGATYPGEEGLRAQWDSFDRRAGSARRQVTMATVIRMAKPRPGDAASLESVMARVDAITAELRTDRGRFATMPIYEVAMQPPGEWLIKYVLPEADLVVLYGASGSGKTFVALDMAFCVAQGLPWRGHKAKQGKVIIIAAEGAGGLGKRAKAYAKRHNINLQDVDIHVISAAPDMLDGEDIAEVLAEIKSHGDVALVIVDTLAQVTPGANENAGEDMGRALANLRLIREAAGATVMVVHHAGKDLSKGSRGWSGIKAAADAQIEVVRHENGQREIHLEKMKDGEDGLRFGFTLEIIELGVDADGVMITSCVAVEADLPKAVEKTTGGKRRGRVENHVLETMTLFGTRDAVKLQELVEQAVATLPLPEGHERDTRRQRVVRAIQQLSREKDGPLQVKDNVVIFFE